MKYCGTLLIVDDMAKSKYFYETIMEQKVLMDLGEHVSLENGLSLQTNYEAVIGKTLNRKTEANNFQLYFETDDIDGWEKKLETVEGVEFIHHPTEYPWGQRSMRFYDFDQYIIEAAERMECVIRRYISQGLTVHEVSERTMYPVEFIETLV